MEHKPQENQQEQCAKPLPQAAGVLLLAQGKYLLLRRTGECDHSGKWCFPGGKVEADETPEQAAIRECHEETGIKPSGLKFVGRSNKHGADFHTFIASHADQQEPTLNAEHDAFHWAAHDEIGDFNLHPGVAETLGAGGEGTELDVANAIRDGKKKSPQYFGNVALFDLRISGTGVAYRLRDEQYVFRDPKLYLNQEFLTRCQGLPVILEHPPENTLNSKEFSDRIIGTILLPYIKGTEVWGIAKVYDDAAAQIMAENRLSTSPAVVFRDPAANEVLELGGGESLLVEGKPTLLDHLAVVELGVWDKGGEPSGVKSSVTNAAIAETTKADSALPPRSTGEKTMKAENPEAEVKKADAGEPSLGDIMSAIQALGARIDQLENAEQAEIHVDDGNMPGAKLEPAGAAPAPAASPDNAVASPEIGKIQARVDALEAKTSEVPEAEAAAMADAQAKADSVYQSFGDAAPRPMMGEALMAYRKRLLSKMQGHSQTFKGIDLAGVHDSGLLAVIENGVYADAQAVALSPAKVPEGLLIESKRTDDAGRVIREFRGSPAAWMGQFKAPKQRVVRINKQFH